MKPRLWIFAGPNGAGKSTLVARMVRGRIPIVNPDEIVTERDISTSAGQLEAGRRALEDRSRRLAALETFGLETT